MSQEIVPPHNRSAEAAVLGCMLRDNETITEVSPLIDADDFYAVAHRLVYTAIGDMHRANSAVDLVTLATELNKRRTVKGCWLDEVGGPKYLADLWDAAPVTGNIVHYAKEIKATSTMRKLIHVGTEIQRLGYQRDGTPPEELATRAANLVAAIQEGQHKDGLVHISVAVDESMQRLERRRGAAADGACEGGIDTPWMGLNNLIVSMNAGEFIIVAARPSVGKTLFGLQLIDHATRMGHRTFFASLEQPRMDIVDRLMSAGTGIGSLAFRTGDVTHEQADKIMSYAATLKGRHLHLDDTPAQSVARIMGQASKLKRRDGLDFIVVDYMGLVGSERRDATTNDRIAAISTGLKNVARHLNVPLVCLCQLNRASEVQGRKPRLSDLRDSGGIEQDADVVMFLWKDAATQSENVKTISVIVEKQRNGPTGEIMLLHRRATYRLEESAIQDAYHEAGI